MNVTIVDNLVDMKGCQRVMDAYYKFQNGELSKLAWENHAAYPRKQWLYFDKDEALPFIVVDNREGECFVEDFETLDGALQYILDIHISNEKQIEWDRHGVIREIGGFGVKGVAPDDRSLAELVLAWAKCDDVIAKKGWDGGSREEGWEQAKAFMVAEAKLQMKKQEAEGHVSE